MTELICGPIAFDWSTSTVPEISHKFSWMFISFKGDMVRRRRLIYQTDHRVFTSRLIQTRPREQAPANVEHLRKIYLPSCVRPRDIPGSTTTEKLRSMISKTEITHIMAKTINP